jgi:hypothetical protein
MIKAEREVLGTNRRNYSIWRLQETLNFKWDLQLSSA